MQSKTVIASLAVFLVSIVALPARADYFAREYFVDFTSWGETTTVYFGGCEEDNESACRETSEFDYYNYMFVIGDYDVKQGVYFLPEASEHDHGKVVLEYSYKFITNETAGDSTDEGRIKIKNTDTEEIYYLNSITPDEETSDWKSERVTLSGNIAVENLQLVFETTNDDDGLSTLYVANYTFQHISEPVISGTISYEEEDGDVRVAANTLVALQNKSRTKTLAYVRTDDNGEYTFFPVTPKKKYVIAATHGDHDGLKTISKKVKNGESYTVNLTLN